MSGRWLSLMPIPLVAVILLAQSSPGSGRTFENQYLKMTVLPGWTVQDSPEPQLNLIHGEYRLSIDPIFTHASGVIGGRFSEVVSGMPSIDAVTRNVDQPAGGNECAQWPPEELVVNHEVSLRNLYTDSSKTESTCIFPSSGKPVWFGSYFSGPGSESDFFITLAYLSDDVNALPVKGDPELKRMFREVVQMLEPLQLKPPITISKIDPASASPGTTVTIYGSGFRLFGQSAVVRFREFPNNPMPDPMVAADGKSLTFQVPTSINTISCPAGRVDVNEFCVPIPANHVDVDDCPPIGGRATNFCGKPVPPGTYQISVTGEGSAVSANPMPLTITASAPGPVSISLLYPNFFVSRGQTITVRGRGFTATGNTVQIGSAVVSDVPSVDGRTITFPAPAPAGTSFVPHMKAYKAWVYNANGQSNPISFLYR